MLAAQIMTAEGNRAARRWMPPLFPRVVWILFAVGLKVILAFYFLAQSTPDSRFDPLRTYRTAVDTESYLRPAENLLKLGDYIYDPAQPVTATRRLPGYSLTYLAFRAMASEEAARRLLAILQVTLSGLSVYVISAAAGRAFRSEAVFAWTFVLYAFQTFASVWDTVLMTESLSASVGVLCAACLIQYLDDGRSGRLFAAGILFLFLFNLRPVMAPMGLLLAVWAWRAARRHANTPKKAGPWPQIVAVILVSAAPLAFEAFWIARNYTRFGRFVPLQTDHVVGVDFTMGPENPSYPTVKDVQFCVLRWIRAVGGDLVWYRPGTLGAWLYSNPGFYEDARHLEPRVLTADYGEAEVRTARDEFTHYMALGPDQNSAEGRVLGVRVIRSFDSFTASYRRSRPFAFWVGNRARLLVPLLVHSGSLYLPLPTGEALFRNPVALSVKMASGGLYWIVIPLGLAGMALSLRRPSLEVAVFVAVPLYSVAALPLLGMVEPRFLVASFPFFTALAAEALRRLGSRAGAIVNPG